MNYHHALLTVEQMTQADRLAVAAGVPAITLMESAGRAVADEIKRRWTPRPMAVLCGPGNNGGDGFVVARHLAGAGWPVRLALSCPPERLADEAKHHAGLWHGGIEPLSPAMLDGAELVVDALFGAGLSRPLQGTAAETLAAAASRKLPIIAVDVPSGVLGDTGESLGAVPSVLTVTFFRKKPGHLLHPGAGLCGEVVVADIGIPTSVLDQIAPQTFENDPSLWNAQLPESPGSGIPVKPVADGTEVRILDQHEYHRHFGRQSDVLASLRNATKCTCTTLMLAGDNQVVVAPDGRAIIHAAHQPLKSDEIRSLETAIHGLQARGMDSFLAAAAALWFHEMADPSVM